MDKAGFVGFLRLMSSTSLGGQKFWIGISLMARGMAGMRSDLMMLHGK